MMHDAVLIGISLLSYSNMYQNMFSTNLNYVSLRQPLGTSKPLK